MGQFDDLIPKKNTHFGDLIPGHSVSETPRAGGHRANEKVMASEKPAKPEPYKIGKEGFAPVIKEMLGENSNEAAMGLQLLAAKEALKEAVNPQKFGKADPLVLQSAKIAQDQAPIGATVGQLAKYAPAATFSGILAPAIAAGGIDYLTTPGNVEKRMEAAGETAAMGTGAGVLGRLGASTVRGLRRLADPKERARDVLEKIVMPGEKGQALWAASKAPGNVSAAQSLVGLNNNQIGALEQILRTAPNESQGLNSAVYYDRLRAAQEAAQVRKMNALAHGSNATETQAFRDKFGRKVNEILAPKLEQEYAAADTAGNVLRRLEPQLAQHEAGQIAALQNQGRALTTAAQQEQLAQGLRAEHPGPLTTMQTRIRDTTQTPTAAVTQQPGSSQLVPGLTGEQTSLLPRGNYPRDYSLPVVPEGLPRKPTTFNQNQEIIPQALETADEFGTAAAQHKAAKDLIQYQINSLGEHGLHPIQIDQLTGKITSLLDSPGIEFNPLQKRALTKMGDMVSAASAKGPITARNLHDFRKTAINDVIDELVAGGASKQHAAKVVSEFKPIVDDIIENAGGTEWKKLMSQYSEAFKEKERLQLLEEARHRLDKTPDKFIDFVKGNDPNAVADVMGSEYDVNRALGPRRSGALNQIADERIRDAALAEQGNSQGARSSVAEMLRNHSLLTRIPSLWSRPVSLANAAIGSAEDVANRAMMREIDAAMRTPDAFAELLARKPLAERGAYGWLGRQTEGGRPAIGAGALTEFNRLPEESLQ